MEYFARKRLDKANKKKSSSSNNNTLQLQKIDPKTGKVTYTQTQIPIVTETRKKSSGSSNDSRYKNISQAIATDGTVTTTVKDLGTGKIISQKIVKPSSKQNVINKTDAIFTNAGLSFINKSYTNKQKQNILNELSGQNQSQYYYKLNAIDNRRDLNKLQKEQEKREVLRLQSNNNNFIKSIEANKKLNNKELSLLVKLSPDEQIRKKIINKETLTPKEQQLYSAKINKQSKQLTQNQINILKNIPKNIGLGVWEVGKETYVFGRDVIKGAYNYGYNLSKKSNNNKQSVLFALATDIKKVGSTTKDITKFVIQNPKASAVIVGASASLGAKHTKNSFIENPVKSLTKAVLYLRPDLAVKGVTKSLQLTSKSIKNIPQRISQLEKVINNKKVPIKTRKQTAYTFLIEEPKFKDVIKSYSNEQFLKLKMSRINNIVKKAKLKELELRKFKAGTTLQRSKDIIISKLKGYINIPEKSLRKLNNKRLELIFNKVKIAKQKPIIKFKAGTSKQIIISKLSKVLGIPKDMLLKLKMSRINNIVKQTSKQKVSFKIETPRPRKKVLGGKKAQSRTLMQQINKVEDKTEQLMSKALKFEKGDVIRFKVGEQIKEVKKVQKANKQNLSKLMQLTKKTKLSNTRLKLIKNSLRLKALERYLYSLYKLGRSLSNKQLKGIKDKFKDALKEVNKIKTPDVKKIQDRLEETIKIPDRKFKRINDSLRDTATIPETRKKQRAKQKNIMKDKTKKFRLPKLPRLSIDDKRLNSRVAVYKAFFRERKNRSLPFNKKSNHVIIKSIKFETTKNRVLRKVRDLVDNRAVRSLQLKLIGVTSRKVKDIAKPNLEKFQIKKGKNSKALILVEKSKFIRDTRGEKREIRSKTRNKVPTRRKTKVSNVKKIKKSSKIKRKRIIKKKPTKTIKKSKKAKKM